MQARYRAGASIEDAAQIVGREIVDWVVLAGTPADIEDRFAEYVDAADRLGFEQVILAVPLGPNPPQAIDLASKLVSRIKQRI